MDLNLLEGNKATALSLPNTMLISSSLAERVFPEEVASGISVLGKSFASSTSGILEQRYVITGVFEDRPEKSHLQFNALVAWASPANGLEAPGAQATENTYTYVVGPGNSNLLQIERKATALLYPTKTEDEDKRLSLRPIADIHLASDISNEPESGVSANLLIFLASIGFIIIVLACTNYINNAIINSIERTKEIGIRKLLGITPWQLGLTLIGEALLANLLAGLLAVMFFLFGRRLIEVYTDFLNPPIEPSNLLIYSTFLVVLLVFSTLLSSVYPAIYLSSLNPINALRGKSSVLKSRHFSIGSAIIRSLLVFQLAASIIFLSAVYIVYRQLKYLKEEGRQSMDLQITGAFPGRAGANSYFTEDVTRFLESVRQDNASGIKISNLYQGRIKIMQEISSLRPVELTPDGRKVEVPSDTVHQVYKFYVIDHEYWKDSSELFLSGENFHRFVGKDFNALILNEAAMQAMGIDHADSAIGQTIDGNSGYLTVLGVVKNQYPSAPPSVYATGYRYLTYFDLKLHYPGRPGESLHDFIAKVEHQWSVYFGGFTFLDRGYDDRRILEQSMLKMFLFFSILAILIANMGMFGLASYITQKRTKEIGIRKILGASTNSIMLKLLSDFLRLILVGFFFAAPLLWLGAREWLQTYPRRMALDPTHILFPVLFILFISTVVIAEKCWKTAIKSPLDSLDGN